MPVLLDQRLLFPSPLLANSEGLVAIGGDLSVPRLLLAYRSGIFPWTVKPVTWWSPDPRAIFELDQFHVSRTLAKVIRTGVFQIALGRTRCRSTYQPDLYLSRWQGAVRGRRR